MEAPVDFRHRQTKRSLPPRAFSAEVQQMPLPWQPLEAIPCLLAMRTFLSASRSMAKTVVSAVKPGGQALQALLVGLSYWCFAMCVGGAVLYIDNGGCSLERRPFARSVARRPRRGPSAGRLVSQSLVPDHLAGVDDAPRATACWPNPVKIAPLLPSRAHGAVARARPQALRLGRLRYPLDPCFHFFPAAKCPTHLK